MLIQLLGHILYEYVGIVNRMGEYQGKKQEEIQWLSTNNWGLLITELLVSKVLLPLQPTYKTNCSPEGGSLKLTRTKVL